MIQLLQAQQEDITKLHTLLKECGYIYHKAKFTQDVLKGYVYKVCSSQTIGTITLYPTKPNEYPFGMWPDTKPSWYISHFALQKDASFYALEVLQTIEQYAQEKKVTELRLALPSEKIDYQPYYEQTGFKMVRTSFFEKTISFDIEKPYIGC